MNIHISLSKDGFQINQRDFRFPIRIDTLREMFGPCRDITNENGTHYKWDELGLETSAKDGEWCKSLTAVLAPLPASPLQPFAGTLLFDGEDALQYYRSHPEKRVKNKKLPNRPACRLVLDDMEYYFFSIDDRDRNIIAIIASACEAPAIPEPLPVDAPFAHYRALWDGWIAATRNIVPENNRFYNLAHGITADDIKKGSLLNKKKQIAIPDALVNFYKIHNVTWDFVTAAFSFSVNNWTYELLPFENIKKEWQEIQDQQYTGKALKALDLPEYSNKISTDNYANPGWIPFADGRNGDYLLFDTAPAAAGKYGQIIELQNESWERNVVADSLEELLQNEITAISNGKIEKFEFILQKIDKGTA